MVQATQVLLLEMGPHWGQHWEPHGGPFFFPAFFGFVHLGLFWLVALGLIVFFWRVGGQGSHEQEAIGTAPVPEPPPAQHASVDTPPWPALYPDEPARPAQGAQDLSPRGPVEYL